MTATTTRADAVDGLAPGQLFDQLNPDFGVLVHPTDQAQRVAVWQREAACTLGFRLQRAFDADNSGPTDGRQVVIAARARTAAYRAHRQLDRQAGRMGMERGLER